MRGDVKYSVDCTEGDGRACADGLEASGEARLEALRLPWPDLR